jgi:hypothetical protein
VKRIPGNNRRVKVEKRNKKCNMDFGKHLLNAKDTSETMEAFILASGFFISCKD